MLTQKQHKQIDAILVKAWDQIVDNVLTKQNKDKDGNVIPMTLLRIESIFKGFAADLGLAALLPGDDEEEEE